MSNLESSVGEQQGLPSLVGPGLSSEKWSHSDTSRPTVSDSLARGPDPIKAIRESYWSYCLPILVDPKPSLARPGLTTEK